METVPEIQKLGYHGKHFTIPAHSDEGFEIIPDSANNQIAIPQDNPIITDINSVWDLDRFLIPRTPVSLGQLSSEELVTFAQPGALRTLDMPIKFPGSHFRLPNSLLQFKEVIEKVANYEAAINSACYDEYYCYMTVDQGLVKPDALQREAPCHVDGFQGGRWNPKVRLNHTYVVTDSLPTTYYIQPFDLGKLDETKHNFFWEMNNIVARTKSARAWHPADGEINLIDAYTVHRGSPAPKETFRTWIRLSFEVRIFDRLGNAKNPLFKYDWPMVKRDIESLNLVAYDETSDPTLRVFPWQDAQGNALANPKAKTQPKLK